MNIRYTPGLENPIQVGVNECLSFNMTMEEARSLQQNLAEIIKSAEREQQELTEFEKQLRSALMYARESVAVTPSNEDVKQWSKILLEIATKYLPRWKKAKHVDCSLVCLVHKKDTGIYTTGFPGIGDEFIPIPDLIKLQKED